MLNKAHQLVLGVGLLGLAAGAWAQGGPDAGPHADGDGWGHGEYHHRHHHHHHHHHHHGWGHGYGGMMGGGGMMLARGLNLTDAQKQQIHTILTTARQNSMKEMKDGKPGEGKAGDGKAGDGKAGGMGDRLALMNPGDPNYATAVQSAKKRAADRIQHMSDLKQQLYNVLTAEQKSEVQKRIAAWKTRMAQREDGSKGPPAPANR